MAAPTVTIRMNTGTEGTPVWTDIVADTLTFCGVGSSDGDLKDNVIPTIPTIIPEMWINKGTDVQCTTYSNGTATADSGTTDDANTNQLIDSTQNFQATVEVGDIVHNTTDDTFAIVTAVDGNTTLTISADVMADAENYTIYEPGIVNELQNVIQIYFATNATVTPPELHAWDDSNRNTWASEVFVAGGTGMIKACETSGGVPPPVWCEAGTPPIVATTNGQGTTLKAMEGYVLCTSVASGNTGKTFNIVCYGWPDNSNAAHTGVLTCHYTYT